jgi:ribonucleoside-diphosphate reductase alpha chain
MEEIKKDYFTNDFSYEVWDSTYRSQNEKTIEDSWKRVAKAVSSVETDKEIWEKQFYNILKGFKFIPGGRILANAGRNVNATLINCFVSPKPDQDIDSLDGIMTILTNQAKTLKSEGGWGLNFSFIRPRGSYIKGIGVRTPGAVKYMELFDKSSEIITEGPGVYELEFEDNHSEEKKKIRKGAMMAMLSIYHPDIEEFIRAKQTAGRLTKMNMSVAMSDKFMDIISKVDELIKSGASKEDIELNDKWQLIFPDTTFENYKSEWDGNFESWIAKGYPVNVYKTVKATDIWNLIMTSTYNRAEPGIMFIDRANKTFAANYIDGLYIDCTNPCGEQALPKAGCCNLGSINLTQYTKLNDEGKLVFDKESFVRDIPVAVRFLDNVLDIANLPLDSYNQFAKSYRRIGLGIMGLGSALMMLGIRYGSEESLNFIKDILNIYNEVALKTSILLGVEKGSYKGFDAEKHKNNIINYYHNMDSNVKDDIINLLISENAMRHTALFSIQPTGNTGCLANNVSGGIEPVFSLGYTRLANVPTIPEHIKDKCPKFWEGNISPNEYFKNAGTDKDPYLEYIDEYNDTYIITKDRGLCKRQQINDYSRPFIIDEKADYVVLANDLTVDEHLAVLEACAKHVDSAISKTINVKNDYPFESFKDIYLKAYRGGYVKGVTTYRDGSMLGVLSTNSTNNNSKTISSCIQKTDAPKRPKTLPCKLHLMTIKKEPWYAIVSLMGEDPYEVFIGKNETVLQDSDGEYLGKKIIFNKNLVDCENATFTKQSQGKYVFKCGDFEHLIERDKTQNDDEAIITAFSRIMSCGLRHGCDIAYLVQQLEKTSGSMVCPTKVFSRVLKKYIKDNTIVAGEKCPECGSVIIRKEGCKTCINCSWSACF